MLENKEKHPIYVDLDGTLTLNDQIWEAVIQFLKKYPYKFFLLFWWFYQGKPTLKKNLIRITSFDPRYLPYNQELISFLKAQKKRGVDLYLITGAPQFYADQVADHLGLFKAAYGTGHDVNLVAENKADFIQKHLPKKTSFIYAGNSSQDIPIWKISSEIIAVNPKKSTKDWILSSKKPYYIYDSKISMIRETLKIMRPYQWVKNMLIFVPLLLASHSNIDLFFLYPIAFLSFSLACSAIYIFNDLFDIQDDRLHPQKCQRPLASGRLKIPQTLGLSCSLVVISLLLAQMVPGLSYWIPGYVPLYIILTTLYTFRIKHISFADVLLLAILYVYRIIVGCAVGDLFCSHWILAFSFFFFLSLAFLKRYVELAHTSKARGYAPEDQPIVQISGIASGFIAFLIFMLYIDSNRSYQTFQTPLFLWLMIPGFIYGHLKFWQAAGQGKMNDDPIVYLFKSKPTLYVLGFMALCFGAAKYVSL